MMIPASPFQDLLGAPYSLHHGGPLPELLVPMDTPMTLLIVLLQLVQIPRRLKMIQRRIKSHNIRLFKASHRILNGLYTLYSVNVCIVVCFDTSLS